MNILFEKEAVALLQVRPSSPHIASTRLRSPPHASTRLHASPHISLPPMTISHLLTPSHTILSDCVALAQDLASAPRNNATSKLNDLVSRARRVRVQALLLHELKSAMPKMTGKDRK